jgi:hypothetical protein
MELADGIVVVLFLVPPVFGLASGASFVAMAATRNRIENKLSLGLSGMVMFALIGWCVFVVGGLPGVILTPGRAPPEITLMVAISLSVLLIVLLWRPIFHGGFAERIAALAGVPFPLWLIGYILFWTLPLRFL